MKVKCIKLLNSEGREIDSSPWLTFGSIYHVMSILIEGEKVSYQLVTHEKSSEWPDMGYYKAECFEVESNITPSNWGVKIFQTSTIDISPRSWLDSNFLEAFHDRDPSAYSIFEAERNIIISEDP